MTEDEKEFSQKIQSQKRKTHDVKDKIDALGKKKLMVDPAKQKQLERAAINQINQATLAGIKAGEEASKRLH